MVKNFPYSVPQDSSGGLSLYSVYASTIQEVIPQDNNPGINAIALNAFADDHAMEKISQQHHDKMSTPLSPPQNLV